MLSIKLNSMVNVGNRESHSDSTKNRVINAHYLLNCIGQNQHEKVPQETGVQQSNHFRQDQIKTLETSKGKGVSGRESIVFKLGALRVSNFQ